jgi:zinc D-Ala-D-Ala carboxypeptidase
MMKVSENFYLSEVIKSGLAQRLKIDNTLPPTLLSNAKGVAENILEPIRGHFKLPYSPQSWYRCPALNKAAGGSPRSEHMEGCAVDIELPGISNLQLARYIRDNLEFNQLILEFYHDNDPYSGWVHVSWNSRNNKREVLRYDGKGYKPGLEDF